MSSRLRPTIQPAMDRMSGLMLEGTTGEHLLEMWSDSAACPLRTPAYLGSMLHSLPGLPSTHHGSMDQAHEEKVSSYTFKGWHTGHARAKKAWHTAGTLPSSSFSGYWRRRLGIATPLFHFLCSLQVPPRSLATLVGVVGHRPQRERLACTLLGTPSVRTDYSLGANIQGRSSPLLRGRSDTFAGLDAGATIPL